MLLIVKNSDQVLIQIKHAKHFLFNISQLAYIVLHHHSSHLLLDFSSENDRFLNTRLSGVYCQITIKKMYILRKTITKIWEITPSAIVPRNHTKLTASKSKDLTVIFACTHYFINIVKSKGFTLSSKAIWKKLLSYIILSWSRLTLEQIWLMKRPNKIVF